MIVSFEQHHKASSLGTDRDLPRYFSHLCQKLLHAARSHTHSQVFPGERPSVTSAERWAFRSPNLPSLPDLHLSLRPGSATLPWSHTWLWFVFSGHTFSRNTGEGPVEGSCTARISHREPGKSQGTRVFPICPTSALFYPKTEPRCCRNPISASAMTSRSYWCTKLLLSPQPAAPAPVALGQPLQQLTLPASQEHPARTLLHAQSQHSLLASVTASRIVTIVLIYGPCHLLSQNFLCAGSLSS